MSLNWSLKELYPSFESEEFKIDMDKLTSKINEINEWANEIVKDNDNMLVKLEEYNPSIVMLQTLEKYINILQGEVA